MKMLIVRLAGIFIAMMVSFSWPGVASADWCCSAKCLFGSCKSCGKNWASCGCTLGFPSCNAGLTGTESEDSFSVYGADDEQLFRLQEYIDLYYALGLYDAGDAASYMYEGLWTGDIDLYQYALAVHDDSLLMLSDRDWDVLIDTMEYIGIEPIDLYTPIADSPTTWSTSLLNADASTSDVSTGERFDMTLADGFDLYVPQQKSVPTH